MLRVHHLITGLHTGGAEMALFRLLKTMQDLGYAVENRVTSLVPGGPLAERIRSLGVEVDDLSMRRSLPGPMALPRMAGKLRRFSPDLLQTWMYHADLLGLMAARLAKVRTVVWNVRCTRMDFSRYSRVTKWTVAACARFSGRPAAVLANSHAGKRDHLDMGYHPKRFEVIPNGIDLDLFRPDLEARESLRAELGVGPDEVLVGVAARFDPMKGHEVLCRAAALAGKEAPGLRLALAGDRMDASNPQLMAWLRENGLNKGTDEGGRVLLLGRRDDMHRVHAGLDVLCSSSLYGEGFPNTVAEAMACGVPCVVTDVGDAARMVGGTGTVVAPGDDVALAAALARMALMGFDARVKLGRAARARAEAEFSLQAMARSYLDLYAELAAT